MKPRIFIGSSVEGLNVAYAIQQNLTHDAESTVWDQGVFELSKTTIESLNQTLDNVDFGVFVFSPDDLVEMRNKTASTIRDNVLFEFGLFVGRLGRDRVFFVSPESNDFHLPTDLLGVTPAKYNPSREDNSLQAATGPACNQIRMQIKKLGLLKVIAANEEANDSGAEKVDAKFEWLRYFLDEKFEEAKTKLEINIKNGVGDDANEDSVWLSYINYKLDEKKGVSELLNLAEKHKGELDSIQLIITFLSSENYYDEAIEIANQALKEPNVKPNLIVTISNCHKKHGYLDRALDILNSHFPEKNPEIAIALSEIYEKNKDINLSVSLLNAAYLKSPHDVLLMQKYAKLLIEDKKYKEAIFLLNKLTLKEPKNIEHWGYLSNACLMLDLYDLAMVANKKADELSDSKSAWILHNIGNLMNNKNFYTEAIFWLKKGLELDQSSQYGHDRLAGAIKSKGEENEKFEALCVEGGNLIREFKSTQALSVAL